MGPVSFQRLGSELERAALLHAAQRLTNAGIRVHAVHEGQGILVRSEDVIAAKSVLASAD